ncbi:MAG: hypothetical protein CR968_01610, partial [Flavobacteriia bacterium]
MPYVLRIVALFYFLIGTQVTLAQSMVPFTGCSPNMYLTQYPTTGGTSLYILDNNNNPLTIPQIGTTTAVPLKINAVGFNPLDNFIYGIDATDKHLFKVDANNNVEDLGLVTGLPEVAFVSGDIDASENYYVKSNVPAEMQNLYKIDLSTSPATATLIPMNRPIRPLDIAYNKVDGLLYGVDMPSKQLFAVNPSDGQVTMIGNTKAGGAYGAIYTNGITGAVYGNRNSNTNPNFYYFDRTTGEATLISASVAAEGNDGAHCVNDAITFASDLSVTKTDNQTEYTPGTTNTYTVEVSNAGPFTAVNATVQDLVPSGIPESNVSYSVVTTQGSSTSVVGTQTGAINDVVNILKDGKITYTITIQIPANYTGNLVNTVSATVSADNVDNDTTNNTVTDTNTNVNSSPILALNDSFSNNEVNTTNGGVVGDITDNDTLNGVPVDDSQINITITDNGGIAGVSVDAEGNVSVPAGIAPGVYVLSYSICEKADPGNCATADVIIEVYRDSDGDGVSDVLDLDDDNDGILDTVEDSCTTSIVI